MDIVYQSGQIVDAVTSYKPLQTILTLQERLAMFGCATPDAALWAYMEALENRSVTNPATAVARMVTIGAISQQRADELLA